MTQISNPEITPTKIALMTMFRKFFIKFKNFKVIALVKTNIL